MLKMKDCVKIRIRMRSSQVLRITADRYPTFKCIIKLNKERQEGNNVNVVGRCSGAVKQSPYGGRGNSYFTIFNIICFPIY